MLWVYSFTVALLLPHSIFIHVPKTGGTWVRKAIHKAGIPTSELACNWHAGTWDKPQRRADDLDLQPGHLCWHNRLRDIDVCDRLTFSFVRHPASMCISYWQYRQRTGWDLENNVDVFLKADTFEEFIKNTLEHSNQRGWVSSMFRSYLLHKERTVDFIGKQENLVEDLVRVLRLAGEDFDEDALRATPMQNVTEQESTFALPDHILDLLLFGERDAIERFGYMNQPTFWSFKTMRTRLRESAADEQRLVLNTKSIQR